MTGLKIAVLLISIFIGSQAWKDKRPDVTTIGGVMEYLEAFNYLPPIEDDARAAQSSIAIHDAIAEYQKFVGINVTGEMNPATASWMQKSRCGMEDKKRASTQHRQKRFILEGSKWKGNSLTYRILNYAKDLEPQTQDYLVAKAFQMWSDYIVLNFERRPWYENTDIDITFLSGGHGDHENFDGKGGVLAHGFYPYYGGDIHFDADELWTFQDAADVGTDYFSTVVHEIGHILGLAHSTIKEAIMWPYIPKYDPNFRLHSDDINGVHRLYGPRLNAPTFEPAVTAPSIIAVDTPTRKPLEEFDPNNICFDGPINAGVTDGNESTYIFRGMYFYEVDGYGVMDGYPVFINDTQRGFSPMSGPIDGALYLEATNELLLFKTYYYASFINRKFQQWGIINERFPGIPPNIDDAFVWPINNKTYFLKGEIYWRMNESGLIDPNYPKPMRGWDMAFGADAAFSYKNQRLYLFRGSRYYRFNDVSYKIDSGYPRDINHWWFGCREFDRAQREPSGMSSSSSGSGSGSSQSGALGPSGPNGDDRRVRSVDDVNPRRRRSTSGSSQSGALGLSGPTSDDRRGLSVDDVNPRFRRSTSGSNRMKMSAMLLFAIVGLRPLHIL